MGEKILIFWCFLAITKTHIIIFLYKSFKNRQFKITPSYGRIEISITGGIFISRQYIHIEEYAEEILQLKNRGKREPK